MGAYTRVCGLVLSVLYRIIHGANPSPWKSGTRLLVFRPPVRHYLGLTVVSQLPELQSWHNDSA